MYFIIIINVAINLCALVIQCHCDSTGFCHGSTLGFSTLVQWYETYPLISFSFQIAINLMYFPILVIVMKLFYQAYPEVYD